MTAHAGDAFPLSSVREIDRAGIRSRIRATRRQLPARGRRRASTVACERLMRLPAFRSSRLVGCYLANDGEIDPSTLIEAARNTGKCIYVPVVRTGHQRGMGFARLEPDTPLAPNRLGISEPVQELRRYAHPRKLDLVVTPLVAFDREGNRLGRGAGFYDRTFAFLNACRQWRKPKLVGLAYDFQGVGRIETSPWDVALECVVTERSIYSAERVPEL